MTDNTMIIDLIRHTKPDIEEGICYGHSDLGLVSGFQNEFDCVGDIVLDHYDLVITSPLQRCALLAATISGTKRRQDKRIMEYNFGDWERLPWSEFKSDKAQQWMNNFVDQPAPNGDSIVSMQHRVLEFWQELLDSKLEKVAVITHSGVQRLIHAHILQTPLTHLFRLELGFGAVIRVKHQRDTALTTVKHLA